MFWYLLGNTPYYSLIFILCFFITNDKLKPLCIGFLGLMLIDQSSNHYILSEHEDWFYHIKAFIDGVWLLFSMSLYSIDRKSSITFSTVSSISMAVNIYLCVNKEYNLIYEYWNEINFLLFEVIIFTFLSKSPVLNKLNVWLHKVAIDMTTKYKNKLRSGENI